MNLKDISISSPIEEKIAWANACYEQLRSLLLEDRSTAVMLENLKSAVPESHAEMARSGIVALCRQCEQDEGGSCCGRGMENKYDSCLLLINRLLEVELPSSSRDPKSCFFLGANGCVLLARHVICINYICKKITSRIAPQELTALREKEGKEIDLVFFLHEQIKGVIRRF